MDIHKHNNNTNYIRFSYIDYDYFSIDCFYNFCNESIRFSCLTLNFYDKKYIDLSQYSLEYFFSNRQFEILVVHSFNII